MHVSAFLQSSSSRQTHSESPGLSKQTPRRVHWPFLSHIHITPSHHHHHHPRYSHNQWSAVTQHLCQIIGQSLVRAQPVNHSSALAIYGCTAAAALPIYIYTHTHAYTHSPEQRRIPRPREHTLHILQLTTTTYILTIPIRHAIP